MSVAYRENKSAHKPWGRLGGSVAKENSDEEIFKIAKAIEDYLTTHPNAKDSVEGVTRWWLARQQYQNTLPKVQAALDYLISQRYLKKKTIAGGITVYSRKSKFKGE